jgi:hypothetical protein
LRAMIIIHFIPIFLWRFSFIDFRHRVSPGATNISPRWGLIPTNRSSEARKQLTTVAPSGLISLCQVLDFSIV